MKQSVVTAAQQIWSTLRHVLRVAPAIMGLVIASLCVDMPMPDLGDGPEPQSSETSSEAGERVETDSQDSNDLVDDINGNHLLSIGPPAQRAASTFELIGGALAGFGARLPRPSAV